MAGVPNDLDASGVSYEDAAASEESFQSADDSRSHSGNEADDDSAEHTKNEKGPTKSLAKGLANCSITPERRNPRSNGTDHESFSEEEMPEEAIKEKLSNKPGENAASDRPKFAEMILEAMVSAGPSRSGVSLQQIKKLAHQKYPELANKSDVYFRNALKRLVDEEKLTRVTGTGASGSFKLAKPDKKKAAPKSKAPAAGVKTAAKAGPKAATTAKSADPKKASSSKSPMKSSGKSAKAAVTKTSVATMKSATVKLTKISNGAKPNIPKSAKSDAVAGTAKLRGRPAKQDDESAAPKSPASKSKAAVPKSAVPSKGSTNVREAPKSPKPKSVAPKSPKPKSVAPKSPKPKSVAPKSPKPKSAAPKSPKPKSVVPKSPAPRTAATKTKLDSASDDAEKTAPGPASKRGKKL